MAGKGISDYDDYNLKGAAFTAQTNGTWFVRGILGIAWRNGRGGPRLMYSFYDLDDTELLTWLAERMRGEPPRLAGGACARVS